MNANGPNERRAASSRTIRLDITWRSVFRILLGILVAYAAVVLWPVAKLLIVATLIAVALSPIVWWVTRRGLPRWVGLVLASGALLVLVVACFAIIGPMVFRQASALGQNLPGIRDQVISHLSRAGPLQKALQNAVDPTTVADSQRVLENALLLVKTTAGGLFEFLLVLALAIYVMVDGPRTLRWLIVFFPVAERQRISEALRQVAELIFAYVAGQCLVSTLAALFVMLLLSVLQVPMALLLGIMAGIFDALPIIGFFLFVSLAMLVGVSVSPTTALLIFAVYGSYHLFENFYILPRVYGNKLKLSKLAVPLAIAAGGLLAGVGGAIAALPIVAAYPVVERLWLATRFEPDTLKAHEGNLET